MEEMRYLCIDLKSFFASVECVVRGLDPMTTPLVVADPQRGEGTICLAVTPAMKALGVKNRCRMFEIPKNLKFLQATPRMQLYLEYSARVYGVYLDFVSEEDIHVYSVDEAFLDVGAYLKLYRTDAEGLGRRILEAVYQKTGLRAACGVGTNLYLAKVALDITAKHAADFVGVLDQKRYQETLWDHIPLTDFWQVGSGTVSRLARYGIFTMRDLAHFDEKWLYGEFGINAELLIDHAKGIETAEIRHIKAYRSHSHSLSSGQVLMRDYSAGEALVIAKEMTEELCLQMTCANLVCSSITLQVCYSHTQKAAPVGGTVSVEQETNLASQWRPLVAGLYARITDPCLPVRRLNLCCNRVLPFLGRQLTLFDSEASLRQGRLQQTVAQIKCRHGKSALCKGMDLLQEATARERNRQIGGHRA